MSSSHVLGPLEQVCAGHLTSRASGKPRGVVVAYAACLLHYSGVLKQQPEG
jgi:hypothetical protein